MKNKSLIYYLKKYKIRIIFILITKILEKINLSQKLTLFKFKLTRIINVGNNLFLGRDIYITHLSTITLGNNIHLGSRCTIDINPNCGGLFIGNNTWISHDVQIEASNNLYIGQNVLIGEFTSIRDTTHSYDNEEIPVKLQEDIKGQIIIGDNVWVGRGVAIIGGKSNITIGKNCIIGANSVVKKSLPPDTVWIGNPLQLLKTN